MINFIGIGATKAGTTWLFDRLRDLNEFRLTPIKELHYFDRDKEYYMSPDYIEITNLKDRVFFNLRWYIRFIKDIGRTMFQYPSFYDFKWVLKWHTFNYSDEMYASMFPDLDSRISGEITPSYSFLKLKDIQRIYKINNDITIKKIRKRGFKCWFCNEVVNSVIGICDDCKPYRLPNVK